jgi:hypothetical protein
LVLLIDNFAQTTPAPISGITGDWTQVVVNLSAGSHAIAWRYSRDSNPLIDGENRGYVDQVKFIPEGVVDYVYETWQAEQFTATDLLDMAISGPEADPDADGIPNMLEAAIGSSPKSGNPRQMGLSLVSTTIAGGGRATVLATNRAATPIRNLKLEIQASSSMDAGSWSTLVEKSGEGNWLMVAGGVAQVQETTASNGSVPVRIEESVAEAQGSRRFYRLVVSVIANP